MAAGAPKDNGISGEKVLDLSSLAMDKYSSAILSAINNTPKTVKEISSFLNIPIAECYRKVKVLEKANLIEKCGRVLTEEGKRRTLYVALFKKIEFIIENSKINIKLIMKNDEEHIIEGAFSPYSMPREGNGILFKRKRLNSNE
ncbi:MAG: helix-turn-helix domain-containing protein [Thermoplasmata archaeon]